MGIGKTFSAVVIMGVAVMMVFSLMPIADVSAHTAFDSQSPPQGYRCHGEGNSPWTHISAMGEALEAIDMNDNGYVCIHAKTQKTVDDSKTNKP